MLHNNKIKKLFFPMLVLPLLGSCIHPRPPAMSFNSNEVAWAQKPGHAVIRGCVSGAIFTKQHAYALSSGNATIYKSEDIPSSIMQVPRVHFTVDLLPQNNYMHVLAKKMDFYGLMHGYKNLNDPRWVDPSVLSYIPHFSCPAAGPDICTSPGHFVWPNLPAGQWYIVTSYDPTKEGNNISVEYTTAGVDVQKITTVEGQTVPFVAWAGTRTVLCGS